VGAGGAGVLAGHRVALYLFAPDTRMD